MYLSKRPRKGFDYYVVVKTVRKGNDIGQDTILYLGRLDNVTSEQRIELEGKIRDVCDKHILQDFRKEIYSLGCGEELIPLEDFMVHNALDHGDVFTQYKIAERFGMMEIINKCTAKGGGTLDVGSGSVIMAINRNCDPCSRRKLPRWYETTTLDRLTGIKSGDFTGRTLLRIFRYLQENNTLPIQKQLYDSVKEILGYETVKIFYDLTSSYFEGSSTICVLIRFGYSRDHRRDKRQIVVGWAVDQEGMPITHYIFSGNTADVKTLDIATDRLKDVFGIEKKVLVVDRGLISKKNRKRLDGKKYHYILAHKIYSTERKVIASITEEMWKDYGNDKVAEVLWKENEREKKYVVGYNEGLASADLKYRNGRILKAERDLKRIEKTVQNGRLKNKDKIAERVGAVLKKYKIKRYFKPNYDDGFSFSQQVKVIENEELCDGMYVLSTTEIELTAEDVISIYRERDIVEKAIQVLKSFLDLRPFYGYTEETIRGHVFICYLAYLIRSIMRYYLKDAEVEMSVEEALEQLNRIKVVSISFSEDRTEVIRKTTLVSGKQIQILDAFDLRDGFSGSKI